MKQQTKAVQHTIIGILAALGACSGVLAQPPQPQPVKEKPAPASLVIPPPNQPAQVTQAQTGKPQLVFTEMEHDFTRIKDEAPVDFDFKFVNKGDGTLKFEKPKPSCGCTAGNPRSPKKPDVDQWEFAPGEEGFIHVSYNPAGKHGDVNQRVTCPTNDPQQPEQILKIHAFVRTTIAFDPPLVSFGEVRAGEPSKQIVKVNGPAGDFKVTYASISKGRFFTVKVLDTKPTTVDGEEMNQSTLELTYNGNAPRGTMQAITTVRTTNDKHPLADLQVMAEVVGDLQVLPPRVNVGIVEAGAPFTKVFKVSSRTNKAFKIVKVDQKSSLPSPLTINVTPAEPGSESAYQVEVKGTSPGNASPITATITLATDNPADKALEVMLNGAVRPPAPPTPPAAFQNPVPLGPGGTPPIKPAATDSPAKDKPH